VLRAQLLIIFETGARVLVSLTGRNELHQIVKDRILKRLIVFQRRQPAARVLVAVKEVILASHGDPHKHWMNLPAVLVLALLRL
jgi:hypothetical protein